MSGFLFICIRNITKVINSFFVYRADAESSESQTTKTIELVDSDGENEVCATQSVKTCRYDKLHNLCTNF